MSRVDESAVPSTSPAAVRAGSHELDEVAVRVLASQVLLLAGNAAGSRQLMQQAGEAAEAADTDVLGELLEAQRHVQRATRVDRVALLAGAAALAAVLSLLLAPLLS
ncbi:MAG: hypothetical protein EA398_12520 [Deltaproteobacteria bacterium]|nr:MAG: hypothetical protein EA398_12520 [Deltaproteobacteria bacterium]